MYEGRKGTAREETRREVKTIVKTYLCHCRGRRDDPGPKRASIHSLPVSLLEISWHLSARLPRADVVPPQHSSGRIGPGPPRRAVDISEQRARMWFLMEAWVRHSTEQGATSADLKYLPWAARSKCRNCLEGLESQQNGI